MPESLKSVRLDVSDSDTGTEGGLSAELGCVIRALIPEDREQLAAGFSFSSLIDHHSPQSITIGRLSLSLIDSS